MKTRINEFTLTANIQIHGMLLQHWAERLHNSIVKWEVWLHESGLVEVLDKETGEIEFLGGSVLRAARTSKTFIDATFEEANVNTLPSAANVPALQNNAPKAAIAQVEEPAKSGELDENGNRQMFRTRKPKKAQ